MSFSDDLDRQRAQIMRAVRHASDGWAAAMRAHKLAPPDRDFANRLRNLAAAAADEQVAWEHAHAAGLLWRPVPGAEGAAPPYELRPGTGRRGPAELWERFDEAVATLNRAITGSSAAGVADAFGDFADVTMALADAVGAEDARQSDRGRDRAAAQAEATAMPRPRANAQTFAEAEMVAEAEIVADAEIDAGADADAETDADIDADADADAEARTDPPAQQALPHVQSHAPARGAA
jgi:hypothetical protein